MRLRPQHGLELCPGSRLPEESAVSCDLLAYGLLLALCRGRTACEKQRTLKKGDKFVRLERTTNQIDDRIDDDG